MLVNNNDSGANFWSTATAGLNFASQLFTNESNKEMVEATNKANQEIANNTNSANMLLNQANIDLQREQNQITRDREDNAVRRRANDLVGAGLSKTLAAGTGASANVMQAPQNAIPMQQAHAMIAHKANAPYMDNRIAEARLENKRLQLQDEALDIDRDNLAEARRHNEAVEKETQRHNEAVEKENARFNTLQDFWKRGELLENAWYHKEAIRVADAELKIKQATAESEIAYKDSAIAHNEADILYKEYQNIYYSAQTALLKQTTKQNAIRLTADLAETSARVASYLSGIRLNDAQKALILKNVEHVTSQIATEVAQRRNLGYEAQLTIQKALTEIYNRSVAQNQGGKTNDTVVTSSVADENAKDRAVTETKMALDSVLGVLGVASRIFLGFSIGGY